MEDFSACAVDLIINGCRWRLSLLRLDCDSYGVIIYVTDFYIVQVLDL